VRRFQLVAIALAATAGCGLLVTAGWLLAPILGMIVAGLILAGSAYVAWSRLPEPRPDSVVSTVVPISDRERLALGRDLPPAQMIVGPAHPSRGNRGA
jgi:hypothetical protein